MPFGSEFHCDHCGATSVLIIDRALVALSTLLKQGEQVCAACGRMALREARFCQAGHTLVRQCVYQDCGREFAVDHQRCDFCGRLQSATWLSEAKALLAAGNKERAMTIVREARRLGYQVEPWARELLTAGDMIGAVMVVREINQGLGLKEAKALVDSWANAVPIEPSGG